MPDRDPDGDLAWGGLLDRLAAELAADYRIDEGPARRLVAELLADDAALKAAVREEPDPARLGRRRAYKDARRRARQAVYYQLRQYKQGAGLVAPPAEREIPAETDQADFETLLAAHSSTRERLPSREAFAAVAGPLLAEARSVVDVGCGLFPLMAPWPAQGRLERYLALDRDAAVVAALRRFARSEPRLEARRWELREGWDDLALEGGGFDLALLLKLVPVVARREPALLGTLARVPARRLLVSVSRIALAKRRDIERRERLLLRHWLDGHGLVARAEWVVGEEVLVLAELG